MINPQNESNDAPAPIVGQVDAYLNGETHRDELAALVARVAELEAALRPFAAAWHTSTAYNRGLKDGHTLHVGINAAQLYTDENGHVLRGAHLHAAADALKGKP